MGILLLHAVLLFGSTAEGAKPEKSEVLICTQAVDGECQKNEPEIPYGTDDIYATWVTHSVPKRGSKLVGTLIAEDVGAVAPPNTKVLDKQFETDSIRTMGGMENRFALKLHFNKPTNGWPPGKYRVEYTQDGKPIGLGRFVVLGPVGTLPVARLGLCPQNPARDCQGVTATFKTDTLELLGVARFSTIPKAGSKVTTKWIALDVGKAAPPNSLIDESVVLVEAQNQPLPKGAVYLVRGTLSRPKKGWPPGRYKAEWAIDGKPLGVTEFEIR
jgi:hypothetical protein